MSPKERRYVAHFLRLWMRFQSGLIHPSLDKHVAKQAGMSQSNLRRVVKLLQANPERMPRLLQFRRAEDLEPLQEDASPEYTRMWEYVMRHGSGYVLPTNAILQGWQQMWFVPTKGRHTKKKVSGRVGLLTQMQERRGLTVSYARSTLRLNRTMDVHAIMGELNRKVFEYHMAQTSYAKEASSKLRGETALFRRGSEYQQHHSITSLGSTGIAMPSNATSKSMGVGRRTFFRYIKRWEQQGEVKRTRRRVRLDPVVNPVEFHRKWGIMPFCVGGLWYGQASNLYESKVDYRGLLSGYRSEARMYGLKGSKLWEMHRNQQTLRG